MFVYRQTVTYKMKNQENSDCTILYGSVGDLSSTLDEIPYHLCRVAFKMVADIHQPRITRARPVIMNGLYLYQKAAFLV